MPPKRRVGRSCNSSSELQIHDFKSITKTLVGKTGDAGRFRLGVRRHVNGQGGKPLTYSSPSKTARGLQPGFPSCNHLPLLGLQIHSSIPNPSFPASESMRPTRAKGHFIAAQPSYLMRCSVFAGRSIYHLQYGNFEQIRHCSRPHLEHRVSEQDQNL
jgi:hypothetical protein